MKELEQFLLRAESVLARVEKLLPAPAPEIDWSATAFRWRVNRDSRGHLQAVPHPSRIRLEDLRNIAPQKHAIEQNTKQFLEGRPANNVLLTGARGTGKSSLIKACLAQFADQGLRLIEVDKAHLVDLPDIVELIEQRDERFILFCDDLSFEEGESGYKALKVALDGSISSQSDNVLIYATSNRRHLLPEKISDNDGYRHVDDGDLHPGETVEEKFLSPSVSDCGSPSTLSARRIISISSIIGSGILACHRRRSTRRMPRPCAGPCSAAHARAVSPGNLHATGPASAPHNHDQAD